MQVKNFMQEEQALGFIESFMAIALSERNKPKSSEELLKDMFLYYTYMDDICFD